MRDLAAHVVQLARDHDITVWVCQNCDLDVDSSLALVGREPREVYLAEDPNASPEAYFVALHELGHHAAHAPSGQLQLDCEAAAWNWALEQAEIKPRRATWELIYQRLCGYVADRRYKATDDFLILLGRASEQSGALAALLSGQGL